MEGKREFSPQKYEHGMIFCYKIFQKVHLGETL